MNQENYQLQIILCSGENNPQKAVLAFAYALAAASTGSHVVIFFTMDGIYWMDDSHGTEELVNGFESINVYWELLTELGATFEGCTSCVENYCNGKSNSCNLRGNMVLAGLSSASIRSLNVPTIVF